MLFDTGASLSILSADAAKRIGIYTVDDDEPLAVASDRRNVPLRFSHLCQIEMFGKTIKDRIPIAEFDAPDAFDGVFSWNQLPHKSFVVHGYEQRMFAVKDISKELQRTGVATWQAWKLQKVKGHAFLEITEGDQVLGRVFLDLGATCGLRLAPRIWNEFRQAQPNLKTTIQPFRYGISLQTEVSEMAFAPSFSLGDLKFINVHVTQMSQQEADDVGEDYLGMIGLPAISHLILLFDREGEKVWTKTIPLEGDYNRFGAVFTKAKEDEEALIAHVVEGTPASSAGLRNGDRLVSMRGCDELTERCVNLQFHQSAGTEIEIQIEGSEGVKVITAKLEDLLSVE